jgi:small subunit ribosomal protein S4e
LLVILRNRLKYALNAKEATMILRQKLVKVDGRARVDPKYPAGFMDVVEIPKTGDRFRIMYDVKGRFNLVKIGAAESTTKLLKVHGIHTTSGRIPVAVTHDGHRIRYPDPNISSGDSVVYDLQKGSVKSILKARPGRAVMVTGGANRGRVGEIVSLERHPGSFDIARLKDQNGNEFATRAANVFVIGESLKNIVVTIPAARGLKPNVIKDREARLIAAAERKTKGATRKVKK